VVWRKTDFVTALRGMLHEFDEQPSMQSLALVWRSPDEYNVLDSWLLKQIMQYMNEKTLRVVVWLNREEAAKLVSLIATGEN